MMNWKSFLVFIFAFVVASEIVYRLAQLMNVQTGLFSGTFSGVVVFFMATLVGFKAASDAEQWYLRRQQRKRKSREDEDTTNRPR